MVKDPTRKGSWDGKSNILGNFIVVIPAIDSTIFRSSQIIMLNFVAVCDLIFEEIAVLISKILNQIRKLEFMRDACHVYK